MSLSSRCKLRGVLAAVLPSLLAASAQPNPPAPPPTLQVTRVGAGRPILFLPGLGSPGEVWQGTVAHLRGRYQCHVVEWAGFAGRKPGPAAPFLASARDELRQYVKEQRLDRPVLVGHSLGGVVALWSAASAPDLFGAVVSVDGVPFLPALLDPSATAEGMRPQAAGLERYYTSMSPVQIATSTRLAAATMVRSPEDVERLVGWMSASDPATLGRALSEMMTTDLRRTVAAIRVPTLLVAAGARATDDAARQTLRATYAKQVEAIADQRVVLAERARHFVMLDDPEFLHATLDAFLAGQATPPASGSAR